MRSFSKSDTHTLSKVCCSNHKLDHREVSDRAFGKALDEVLARLGITATEFAVTAALRQQANEFERAGDMAGLLNHGRGTLHARALVEKHERQQAEWRSNKRFVDVSAGATVFESDFIPGAKGE